MARAELTRDCDFCKLLQPLFVNQAIVDGPTKKGYHAYMCQKHFDVYGISMSSINTWLIDPRNINKEGK